MQVSVLFCFVFCCFFFLLKSSLFYRELGSRKRSDTPNILHTPNGTTSTFQMENITVFRINGWGKQVPRSPLTVCICMGKYVWANWSALDLRHCLMPIVQASKSLHKNGHAPGWKPLDLTSLPISTTCLGLFMWPACLQSTMDIWLAIKSNVGYVGFRCARDCLQLCIWQL